jgi:hypothetical protein
MLCLLNHRNGQYHNTRGKFWYIGNTLKSCVLSNKEILTINRRSDRHEVLEILRGCENCCSAVFGWTIVYSQMTCWKM